MASLFFSYSRRDIASARKLTKAFEGQDLDFWIDWEGIPPTVDWWKEIEKAIEEADIFLFLLSPDSANSKVCKREIEHATRNGKRLIPVVIRDVNTDEAPSEIQPLNWIFLRENDNFNDAFGKLITAIKTDYAWVQIHRQLQVKALEWERSGKEDSFLLRGKELQDAKFQLETNSAKEPIPTSLQSEYVFSSQKAITRQQRVALSISLAVVIIIAWLIYTPLKSWLSIPEMPEWEVLTTFKGQSPRHVTMNLRNPDEVYLSDQTPGILHASTDGGNHWNDLVIPEMNSQIVGLSALESNLYVLTSKALWLSVDKGKTWETMKDLPCDDNADLLSISINPINGDEIYVGANNGMVCHIPDKGKTWEFFQQGYDGKSINAIATNGSTIVLATEEGLWVKSTKSNGWAELSLKECSQRSDEVRALAFTRPYEGPPPDETFSFFSAIPGVGICDSDTLNLYGSTQISLPDDSYVNISSIVIADIPGWAYEGYMTIDGKILRKRIWYADDFEWWKIKIRSLLTKGD